MALQKCYRCPARVPAEKLRRVMGEEICQECWSALFGAQLQRAGGRPQGPKAKANVSK